MPWDFPALGWLLPSFAVVVLMVYATLHLIVQSRVNVQLGFDYATPQVSWHEEIFLITRVDPGRAMALAGVREGDRVLLDDVSELYARLIRGQGGTAIVPIAREGRVPRAVVVRVPRMELPFPDGMLRLLYGAHWVAKYSG